jgi:glucokinase
VLGAPPVEEVASGPALARAAGLARAEDVLADPAHAGLVGAAAAELGRVLAVLANALDPAVVVLGGGLGSAPAFVARVEAACRPLLAYPSSPPLSLLPSALGSDGGVVGAALAAVAERQCGLS